MININKITILVASVTLLCLKISSNESFDYSSRDDVKEYIEERLDSLINLNNEGIFLFSFSNLSIK